MRRQIVILGILSILFVSGLWIKVRFYPVLTRHTFFYFHSLFWISGLLIIVFIANIIYTAMNSRKKTTPQEHAMRWLNRRECYRVVYPRTARPILTVKKKHSAQQRQLDFQIVDISEQGICFRDNGSLGPLGELEGIVRFHNGETHRISGCVVRQTHDSVCVQLHSGIPWNKILAEQRRLISRMDS